MGHTVEIPPLALSAVIPVRIKADRRPELDEAFSIQLFAPENASLGDARGSGTIRDDDR